MPLLIKMEVRIMRSQSIVQDQLLYAFNLEDHVRTITSCEARTGSSTLENCANIWRRSTATPAGHPSPPNS
ncbi:hypothetical protein VARIO8X_110174 [Burkholderiales bacterium 8X]|nr:hypothetical protein VARIO8X_110174 [Burkholderiales bacterium 8X]